MLQIGGKKFYDRKKLNSDKNSGVQKVRNWKNRGVPQNSEQISAEFQASFPTKLLGCKVAMIFQL